ncbi:MAG: hypothetical protein ACKO5A_08875 [Actinomycetota bacterium]
MGFRIVEEDVEPVVAGLLGAIDVDDGPQDEQLAVLDSVVRHLLGRRDLDLDALEPLGPTEVAATVTDPMSRRRFHWLLVALESCRHPLGPAQVGRVEEYCDALDVDGADRQIFRDLVTNGTARAAADFRRFLDTTLAARVDPPLRSMPVVADAPEPDLAERIGAFAELPDGSLGRAFVDFHTRNHLPLPGVEASPINHFFVGHDMTHTIAGIEPTGPGEVALSAFQMAAEDNPLNTAALLASLVVHEVGFERSPSVAAEAGILATPGAAELLGSEMARGAACTADFSLADHFELAPLPLSVVRERFGVLAPVDPDDGHHCW